MFKKTLERVLLWLWSKKADKEQIIVIDSNRLLDSQERNMLFLLEKCDIRLPLAVWEEVRLLAGVLAGKPGNFKNASDKESKEIAAGFMKEMVEQRKNWQIAGSKGTGLTKKLSRIKLENFSRGMTLEEMLGINDLRILATCLNILKSGIGNKRVILITKDKSLQYIAQRCTLGLGDIKVLDSLGQLE